MITLGINYQMSHDSAACLVKDGRILFAVAEERLSRLKHDSHFPARSIKACLEYARVTPEKIDHICFGWPQPYKAFIHDLRTVLACQQSPKYIFNTTNHFFRMFRQKGGMRRFISLFGSTNAKVHFVDHHLAHAISAYCFSGLKKATIVVIDGRGAWESTSIWYGHEGRIDHILTIPWPNSLGLFYAEFTHYLGFERYSDEWKVMGLAPYGKREINLNEFINSHNKPYWVNVHRLLWKTSKGISDLEILLGPKRCPETEINERHKNIAFAVQEACEQAMFRIVQMAIERTHCRNLCLAGGVALNSKANGKILSSGLVDQMFVQPASSDDGVALGAALIPYLKAGHCVPVAEMKEVYLGPGFDDHEIESQLRAYKLSYIYLEDPTKVAAKLLSEGNIIGWFQGRMEFGPRALGNRSILADPRDPMMKDKVNNAVKFRESWRPFAPSILAEAAPEYFECASLSPFMIFTFRVKSDKRDIIPAVTHVDGSARVQTVEKNINPLYWQLIKEFERLTHVPVVMNTSFNLRGEPIVCSPGDAIRTFFCSGMDALIIGNYLVRKNFLAAN